MPERRRSDPLRVWGRLLQYLIVLWPVIRLFALIVLVGLAVLVGLPAVLASAGPPS
jgi:hypothetical protein